MRSDHQEILMTNGEGVSVGVGDAVADVVDTGVGGELAIEPSVGEETHPCSSPPELSAIDAVIEARDFYEIFHISQSEFDESIIRKKFKRMVLQVHPDKLIDGGESERERADLAFKKLHRAYTVLTDSSLRRIYDKFGIAGDSFIEQAQTMFPGMDLEVAVEIVGLVMGSAAPPGHSPAAPKVSMSEMSVQELGSLVVDDAKSQFSPLKTMAMLVTFYLVLGLV